MNVKGLKRKCSVRGCKNTDTYCISRSREVGGSVIICIDCLKDGLKYVKDYIATGEKEVKKDSTGIPNLFFNGAIVDEKPEETSEAENVEEPESKEQEETKIENKKRGKKS